MQPCHAYGAWLGKRRISATFRSIRAGSGTSRQIHKIGKADPTRKSENPNLKSRIQAPKPKFGIPNPWIQAPKPKFEISNRAYVNRAYVNRAYVNRAYVNRAYVNRACATYHPPSSEIIWRY